MVICGELCGGFVVAKNVPSFLNKSVESLGAGSGRHTPEAFSLAVRGEP
jgi:hypothetical protein